MTADLRGSRALATLGLVLTGWFRSVVGPPRPLVGVFFTFVLTAGCSLGGIDGAFVAPTGDVDTGLADAADVGPDAERKGVPRDGLPDDVACLDPDDCYPTEGCEDFVCTEPVGNCRADRDCLFGPACHTVGECIDQTCHYEPLAAGAPCAEPDECTVGSVCNEALECVRGESACELPAPVCDLERATMVVPVGVADCSGGEDPCVFYYVGIHCPSCDAGICLCDTECPPKGGAARSGLAAAPPVSTWTFPTGRPATAATAPRENAGNV